MRRLALPMISLLAVLGCHSGLDAPDERDADGLGPGGKADGGDFTECELARVLEHLNSGVGVDALLEDGVHTAAADHIVAHRDGPDAIFGTDDDDLFDDAEELDAVGYVGVVAMRQLVAIVEDACERAPASCPDAPVLGHAGQTALDAVDVPFAWGDGWAVGEPVTVAVPADLVGLLVAVEAGEADTGLGRVLLDGETLLDMERDDPMLEGGVAPFFHVPVPVGAVTFPMDAHSQLTEGCFTVTPVALDDVASARLTFVSRRRPAGGAIDVNAIVVGGSAIEEAQLREVFGVVASVYERAGDLTIGAVDTHALAWPSAFVDAEGADIHALRRAFVGEDPSRLNVYLVQDFLEEGTLGFAAGIPGPNGLHGTAASGLVISLDSHLLATGELDLTAMGETIAHEIGHQLGLFHTSEADGLGHDVLEDTPRCGSERDRDGDGEVSAEECAEHGARNVMFWTSGDFRQDEMSPVQASILETSGVVR